MSIVTIKPRPKEIEEAKRHPNGWVYRIEGDFTDEDSVPPTAIVGAWQVDQSGSIVGAFRRNPKYRVKNEPRANQDRPLTK